MFCDQCGRPVENGSSFCSYCGKPVPADPAAQQAQTDFFSHFAGPNAPAQPAGKSAWQPPTAQELNGVVPPNMPAQPAEQPAWQPPTAQELNGAVPPNTPAQPAYAPQAAATTPMTYKAFFRTAKERTGFLIGLILIYVSCGLTLVLTLASMLPWTSLIDVLLIGVPAVVTHVTRSRVASVILLVIAAASCIIASIASEALVGYWPPLGALDAFVCVFAVRKNYQTYLADPAGYPLPAKK